MMIHQCVTSTLLLAIGLVIAGSDVPRENRPTSVVLELNERFLEVMNDGLWFVEFYAPWCGHCKQLAPVWEQVGHQLAEDAPSIRVGKVDCTRFTGVSSALNIRGFPTLKFFKRGEVLEFEGDRSKEALVQFALKAGGPAVREIEPGVELSALRAKHANGAFFVFYYDPTLPAGESEKSPLAAAYQQVASNLSTKSYFYRASSQTAPAGVLQQSTAVVVYKDDTQAIYSGEFENADELNAWVQAERWPAMPQLTYGNLKDLAGCCDRLLVIVVADLVQKSKTRTMVQQFTGLIERISKAESRQALQNRYFFAWTDGDAIASSIVLGSVPVPSLMVFNYSSNEYYLYEDSPQQATTHSVLVFLQQVMNGERQALGGRGLTQRAKRFIYEIYSTVHNMFATQPLLTCCLFGLPTAIFGIICYTLCSADFSVEHEEVYPETDDEEIVEDEDTHEKAD